RAQFVAVEGCRCGIAMKLVDGEIHIRLLVLGIEVKAAATFAPEQSSLEHLGQQLWSVKPWAESGGNSLGNVAGHINADFINQAQGSHGHAEIEHRFVDILHASARLEKMSPLNQ